MEYVEGETLKELHPPPRPPAGRRGGGASSSSCSRRSSSRTRNNVVHRDIKSQNILIDRHGKVKVTDFGIARAGDSAMTEAGSILGTAQYLAPEQARGEQVDERSDLYSVGVVLYEMLTGTVPFKGDSAVTVALKHVNELPAEPAELVPGLPYALNQIVLKAWPRAPTAATRAPPSSPATCAAPGRRAAAGGHLRLRRRAHAGDAAAGRAGGGGHAGDAGDGRGARGRVRGGPGDGGAGRWLLALLLLLVVAGAAYAVYHALSGTASAGAQRRRSHPGGGDQELRTPASRSAVHDDYSDQFAKGFVTRQQPSAGTKLIRGQGRHLGERGRRDGHAGRLPRLDRRRLVADWLKDNGLVGDEKNGHVGDRAGGKVYKQAPTAGADREPRRHGHLLGQQRRAAGGGARLERHVPGRRAGSPGGGRARARRWSTTQTSDTVPSGEVISQDPPAGTKVDKGSRVDIVVSSGSPTSEPDADRDGHLRERAQRVRHGVGTATSTLSAAGFLVQRQGEGQRAAGRAP